MEWPQVSLRVDDDLEMSPLPFPADIGSNEFGLMMGRNRFRSGLYTEYDRKCASR